MTALMHPQTVTPALRLVPPLVSDAPATAGEPHGSARPPSSVYRRRRMLAAVLVAILAYGAWSLAVDVADRMFTGEAGASSPAMVEAPTYVVQPGDTLWSIAAGLDRGGDLRATVDELADLNDGSSLQVGQRLVLPPT